MNSACIRVRLDGNFAFTAARPEGRLAGMRIIVTAGPTREYIDDVRFISNASSGRMGYAVAAAGAAAGHEVTLLAGPGVAEKRGQAAFSAGPALRSALG